MKSAIQRRHLLIPRRGVLIAMMLGLLGFSPARVGGAEPPITAAAFSASGTEIVIGSQAGLRVARWPWNDGPLWQWLATEAENIHHLSFSPDDNVLVVAGGSPGSHGLLESWNWPHRQPLRRDVLGTDVLYHVIWSADSSKWVTTSGDSTCRVIDALSGEVKRVYQDHSRPVLAVQWVGSQGHVVSVGVDQTLRLWDSTSGQWVRTLDNHLDAIQSVLTLPNPGTALPVVATLGDDQTVRLWQPTVGRMMRFIKLVSKPTCAVASADGKQLFVGCTDGSVAMIDTESMRLIDHRQTQLDFIYKILLTPDHQCLLACGAGGKDGFVILQPIRSTHPQQQSRP